MIAGISLESILTEGVSDTRSLDMGMDQYLYIPFLGG